MTDAVSKNLKVEVEVSRRLETDHIPIHILCKSHTCEKLDDSCISVLVKVEVLWKITNLIVQREPRLRSFVRQSRSVAMCAMKGLLTLVSNEASAKPTSLSKEFDLILEKDHVAKPLSLYKDRRFTKLGYTAGAIVDCIPQFTKLLNQAKSNNLLAHACRIYLESEYVIAAFKTLSNFTYHVTMPFLNCVEKSDQNDLIKILPTLHTDLKDGKLDTLKEFSVPWTRIKMEQQKPETELDNYLLTEMCKEAAHGVKMQCAREYWGDEREPRAAELHKMSEEKEKTYQQKT